MGTTSCASSYQGGGNTNFGTLTVGGTFATRSRAQKREERELNPQGSSLGRFRDGCHRQLACTSVRAAAAGIEPATVSLTGSRLTIGPHRKKSGRWDLNPRFPVPETGGFPGFPTS